MKSIDTWGETPGDFCRVLHPGTAWLDPRDCTINETGSFREGPIWVGFDQPVLIIATTKEAQPKPGWNWTWCLLLTHDQRLCWMPSSLLRRLS